MPMLDLPAYRFQPIAFDSFAVVQYRMSTRDCEFSDCDNVHPTSLNGRQ